MNRRDKQLLLNSKKLRALVSPFYHLEKKEMADRPPLIQIPPLR